MINYELRLLDVHDAKIESVLKDPGFQSRVALYLLKERPFKANVVFVEGIMDLLKGFSGSRDSLILSVMDYLQAISGMTNEVWKTAEKRALIKGLFQKGGYVDIREHIKEQGRQEGLQEGRQEGLQEGLQEGRQEGLQEGRQKGRQELILKMLKKELDISLVSEVTGFSEEEINKLKNGS